MSSDPGGGPETVGDGGPGRAHCTGCGSAQCAGCGRSLDPPRFCPDCGRRLTVAVHPAGYDATCRLHGAVAGAGTG